MVTLTMDALFVLPISTAYIYTECKNFQRNQSLYLAKSGVNLGTVTLVGWLRTLDYRLLCRACGLQANHAAKVICVHLGSMIG